MLSWGRRLVYSVVGTDAVGNWKIVASVANQTPVVQPMTSHTTVARRPTIKKHFEVVFCIVSSGHERARSTNAVRCSSILLPVAPVPYETGVIWRVEGKFEGSGGSAASSISLG